MKAYQFADPTTGLELKDLPVPEPGPEQVLIAVEAAGLCHTDIHIINGHGDAWIMKKPIILGHEVAGTVAKLGPGVSSVKVGDKVVVAQVVQPVGETDWFKSIGMGYDGGYAEYAIAYLECVIPIPEGVSFAQAAVATDSIATAYHAVVSEACVVASMTIAVLGLGGLGMNGVTIAALQGAIVYGVDIDSKKFEDAKRCGARECATSLEAYSDIKFDAIIDFAGVGSTTVEAIASVKAGGSVLLVGLAAPEVTVSTTALVLRGITLRGSIGASIDDLRTVLGLIAAGSITPMLTEIPFAGVHEGLHRLERGEASGRLFTRPQKR